MNFIQVSADKYEIEEQPDGTVLVTLFNPNKEMLLNEFTDEEKMDSCSYAHIVEYIDDNNTWIDEE